MSIPNEEVSMFAAVMQYYSGVLILDKYDGSHYNFIDKL